MNKSHQTLHAGRSTSLTAGQGLPPALSRMQGGPRPSRGLEKKLSLLYSQQLLTPSVWVFPAMTDSPALWTPTGCPPVHSDRPSHGRGRRQSHRLPHLRCWSQCQAVICTSDQPAINRGGGGGGCCTASASVLIICYNGSQNPENNLLTRLRVKETTQEQPDGKGCTGQGVGTAWRVHALRVRHHPSLWAT